MLNAQSQLCVSTLALRSAIHKQGERLAVLAGQYRELIGTKPTGLVTRIFKGGYSAASLIRAIDQVSKLLADEQSQHERSSLTLIGLSGIR
jgi:hypothetical protein